MADRRAKARGPGWTVVDHMDHCSGQTKTGGPEGALAAGQSGEIRGVAGRPGMAGPNHGPPRVGQRKWGRGAAGRRLYAMDHALVVLVPSLRRESGMQLGMASTEFSRNQSLL
jgi:hypothetical protein